MTSLLIAAAVVASQSVFVEAARAGTARYADQSVAIADGYRRIGRDFPAMGEHWIRISLVFDGKVDPSRPEVLNYGVIDGTPRLLGVGYAVPLLKGEIAPAGPAGRAAWHDHFRTIEDETVVPHHHHGGQPGSGPRLAMLHAWIWTPNSHGMFAADNWTLPYLRLGFVPHETAPSSVAKALALASGGRAYFEMAVDTALEGVAVDRKLIASAFDRAQVAVEGALRERRARTLADATAGKLAGIWTEMWAAIDAAAGSEAIHRVMHLPVR